nr:hypothetical protein [Tanacetum cinerariifolium]
MAISVALVSSDLSEESVGIPTGRVILFGTIPTTIPDTTPTISSPATHTDTTEIPTIAPTTPLSPDDTPDTPPSTTLGTPFTKITSFTHISSVIPHRRVMILTPEQPIPHGRPYHYHPNGSAHMMTVRKKVGPLHVQQLAVGYLVDHSSSDYFSPDDST